MKKVFLVSLLLIIFMQTINCLESDSLKVQGIEAFKAENYPLAIELIESAIKLNQQDAELYYYQGFFLHYRAYDSRPLLGYDFNWSQKVFNSLDKALELNPDYGDAKYFYGAECSANAFNAMQNYDAKSLKKYYKLAFSKGAYPEWLLEFGRNILNSCAPSAILFTGGNADFDICMYLQLHENLRKDISVIPLSQLERPWYISFVKKGLKNAFIPVNLKMNEKQISDVRPYKWKDTVIQLEISEKQKIDFNLPSNYIDYLLTANLSSNRYASKIKSEEVNQRTLVSVQKAILVQIIEDNWKTRPIYFTNCSDQSLIGGFDNYLQNFGLVSKLYPIQFKEDDKEANDFNEIDKLLQKDNLKGYQSIAKNDIPRISMITFLYLKSFFIKFSAEIKENNLAEAEKSVQFYKDNLMPGLDHETETQYLNLIEDSIKKIKK